MIYRQIIFIWLLVGLAPLALAQLTNTAMSSADAFVCTGSPNYQNGADLTGLNFGDAGTLAIAPASAAKGEFRSVMRFSLSNVVSGFNAVYGTNGWQITGISLELTSNYGTGGVQPNNPIFNVISGGQFVIEWLADADWIEGAGTPSLPTTDGVTWNSLPALLVGAHVPLCTNTYLPPGNNVHVFWPLPLETQLVADAGTGGKVSFYFYSTDEQVGYLFNSYKYGRGNEPLIHVIATPWLRILSGMMTNGAFHLTGIGNNNSTYTVQAATNLATGNWQDIGTVISDSAGIIEFDDPEVVANEVRFYRLRQ